MTQYTPSAIAIQLVRLVNAAFQWTEKDACAVATINDLRPHKFIVNINGQEFTVTVSETK